MKFKVGDMVKAKYGAPYLVTKDGWTGMVIEILDCDYVKVAANISERIDI